MLSPSRRSASRVVAVSFVAVVVAAGALAGCSGGGTAASGTAAPGPPPPGTSSAAGSTSTVPGAASAVQGLPRPAHVVVVVEENHSRSQIIGNPDAPYISSLAASGANLTGSHAVAHPSQPNYLALFSGSTQGVDNDSCPHTFGTDNLGRELLDQGLTFAGYSEGLPNEGFTGCRDGAYARKHNPWSDFSSLPSSTNRTFEQFPRDYASLPTVSFVVPDLDHDMHDGSVSTGDDWLRTNLDGYLRWARTHDSLLVVTWDEADHSRGNQIATVVAGARVTPGEYPTTIDHYDVLRTIEDMYGLRHAGLAADATPITSIWD